jgi:DNA gyrase/topoisomerase IV subunit A
MKKLIAGFGNQLRHALEIGAASALKTNTKEIRNVMITGLGGSGIGGTIVSELVAKEKFILSITENGYGKRTSFLEYRVTNRGGKGIIGIVNSPRNGDVASTIVVEENDEIILSTDKGSVMRCAVKEIRSAGRNTQGVTIKKLSGSEKVVSAIKIEDNIN